MKELLLEYIHAKDAEQLNTYISSQSPMDICEVLRDVDEEEIFGFFSLLNEENIAKIIENAEEDQRFTFCKHLDNTHLLKAFTYMEKDDIVDILGDLSIGRRKELLTAMKADDKHQIATLLQYPEDSAGGIMTTAYIALKETMTIEQALQKIRQIGPKTEVIEILFVINENRELVGKCDLRDLLSKDHHLTLEDIMNTKVYKVSPEEDQELVAKLVAKYDLKAIPVVSAKNQILGIITLDDVIDVIIEEDDEDMLSMAGVNSEENMYTTLSQSIKMRLPWLLVNLATAFLASLTVKSFESTIAQVVALSSVMTIVTGMGGNAGTQTTSIMVRQLADNDLTFKKCIKPFFKEILLGLVDGAVNGLVTGVIVSVIYHNMYLGIIIVLAMIGNMIIAGVFGFIIPVLLKKFHQDPAVSSSIFLTTATDVLGFFIFLTLAKLFMPLLLK